MRAVSSDSDQAVGNSVESCKDESMRHKRPELIWEDGELKILKNGKNNGCELFYDTRSSNECDKENDVNALKHHACGDSEMIRGKSHDTAANKGLFYMDKNVTACDLPEIVVCYKENTYHVVKDICVDEGVPVHEKFLFGEKDPVKCSSNSNQCEDLAEANLFQGSIDNLIDKVNVNPLEPKSSEDRSNGKVGDSELCNDPKTKQEVEESSREDFADAESSSSCNQEHLIVTREAKEVVATSENVLPSPSQLQENEQRRLETTALETKEARKAEEMLSSVSTTTSQEPEEDKLFSSGFGETSFSAAEAVSISGHISHSGPVVVSGRLSVRSDASTTSGRSFAFPILQSEWHSSPERMAKAEKRRLKGWRDILLCCRFS